MTTLVHADGVSCYRCHGQLSKACVPNLSYDCLSQSCSAKGRITPAVYLPHMRQFCLMRQNRHNTKMYVVHHNALSDSFRIRIVWFQPKQDLNWIRISFFKNRTGSNSKKALSDHLWFTQTWYTILTDLTNSTEAHLQLKCNNIQFGNNWKMQRSSKQYFLNNGGMLHYFVEPDDY